jgi:ADP-ribosyl-[dinitrogen reductase] hydrolase
VHENEERSSDAMQQPHESATRADRLGGMIAGVCVGDALGVNVEFARVDPPQRYTGRVPSEPFEIVFRFTRKLVLPGSVSDDSEMTIALLRTVLANGGAYDRGDALRAYLEWANAGLPQLGRNTRALMKGVTTVRGFEARRARLIESGELDMAAPQSNGTLMRASSLVLLPWQDVERAIDEDCALTNDNAVNRAASRLFVACLRLYVGAPADLMLDALDSGVHAYLLQQLETGDLPRDVAIALDQALDRQPRDVSGSSKGWVCHALYCGLYAALHFGRFDEAMRWVVAGHPGSDTDTNASIAGALLGARLGLAGLREEPDTSANVDAVLAYFRATPSAYKIGSLVELGDDMARAYHA